MRVFRRWKRFPVGTTRTVLIEAHVSRIVKTKSIYGTKNWPISDHNDLSVLIVQVTQSQIDMLHPKRPIIR